MDDVCLLLEGTYPYVSGGVSSWVYQIIKNLKDTTFSVVYLGAHRSLSRELHYELPGNIRDFREYYLFDYRVQKGRQCKNLEEKIHSLEMFVKGIQESDVSRFDDLVDVMGEGGLSLHDIAHSKEGWNMIQRLYLSEEQETSFLDYFWSWRFIFLPFLSLLKIKLPLARVYHSPSTGYAGVLGALAKAQHNRPFMLTEHGIYTRERRIDLAQADWIYSDQLDEQKVTNQKDFFRDWWISLFTSFSKLSYERADQILTLYEGNRRVQIKEGAPPEKVRVVPNGIPLSLTSKKESSNEKLIVGFVGRIVSIKDVKTFIRACKIVKEAIPNVEFWLLGPTDEEEDYYEECRILVQMSHLEECMIFKGKVDLSEYYPSLDLLVLTSVSEGQPLVVLEAYAYKIPAVMTDVGACTELAFGSDAEDRLIGQSGIVTPVCNPEETAKAIIQLLNDDSLREEMGQAGHARVVGFYQQKDMLARYQRLYHKYMEKVNW